MKTGVYAVYDVKATAYGQPFTAQTDGLARRMFGQACLDPSTSMHAFPADFSLVKLAEYDDFAGAFENQQVTLIDQASVYADRRVAAPLFEEAADGQE